MKRRLLVLLAGLVVPACALAIEWDPAAHTAVVYNADFPGAADLARYYAQKRGIPKGNLIALKCSQEEIITRAQYEDTLRAPLLRQLTLKYSFVALMRGVPLKISQLHKPANAGQEDEASVDSEIACLRLPEKEPAGLMMNPYFEKKERIQDCRTAGKVLLVGRLDGASDATVRRMIDDAVAVEPAGLRGRAVIDLALKTGPYEQGEEWLRRCIALYKKAGIPVCVDRYEPVFREGWPLPDTALYFGWYISDISGALKSPAFRFKRGAVACHLHSFSASQVRTDTAAWAGPLLERGAAAVMGNVWEPYLTYTVHFDVLNERLLAGFTLAEAAWCATPGLSWMSVVLGDPLYRPFAALDGPGTAEDRDYALYREQVIKHAADGFAVPLKRDLLDLARKHKSPRLIELLGLLSSQESRVPEALALMEHARSVYPEPADRVRAILYQVELLLRERDAERNIEARALLKQSVEDKTLAGAPGSELLAKMLAELGGE